MSYKSDRSKFTNISKKTKEIVWERDGHRCIFCGSHQAMPNAHIQSRAYGGSGQEENIVTACFQCHHMLDQSIHRKDMLEHAKQYLIGIYDDWEDMDFTYRRD